MLDRDGCPTPHEPTCPTCLDAETRGSMAVVAILLAANFGLVFGLLIGFAFAFRP